MPDSTEHAVPESDLPAEEGVVAPAAAATRKRPKPGERRVQILQTLAAMLEQPGAERITTAALAAALQVSEAALYRHYIRTVTELGTWFSNHGLDHTRCQAALAFPAAQPAARASVEQHRDLAARFDVDVIEFPRP